MKVMRIMGKIQFVEDEALKARVLEERPFLKDFIMNPKDPILVLFRVVSGEAYFWTMANNMKESMIERLRFTAE
jgi:pyridoxamine 5'-phosphate oxidase